jgi:hypothetical protein
MVRSSQVADRKEEIWEIPASRKLQKHMTRITGTPEH